MSVWKQSVMTSIEIRQVSQKLLHLKGAHSQQQRYCVLGQESFLNHNRA